MKRIVPAAGLVILVFGLAILAQTQTGSVEQKLIKLENEWAEAVVKRDAAVVMGRGTLEADRVYVNGTIYTVDKAFSKASAMAVKDGRFIFVGDEAGAKAYMGPLTLVFDLKGHTVIPGLHDAHVHIQYGETTLHPRTLDIRANLGEWASVKRMQEVIKRCLATGEGMRPGPEPRWLELRGWMSDV